VHSIVMGSGQQQVSPPSQTSNGPKNGMPKSVTIISDEPRHPKERVSFRKDVTDDSQHPKSSFKIKPGSFLSKGTSDQKWQRAHMVVGALEVKSDIFLQPKEDMKPLYKNDQGATASKFEDALQAWEDLDLRKSFTNACADLPDFVCCCGLSQSDNASMIKQYATLLNAGWVKHANSKIRSRGFKIDACIWNCQNSSGKSSTNILLVRFFELSTYKFRRASEEGSLDLDDMLMGGNADNSSHYSVSHNSSEDNPDH
jgi:hypothetical protein